MGIDESGYGQKKVPEVVVAVYSEDLKKVDRYSGRNRLSKIREHRDLKGLLENNSYAFILRPETNGYKLTQKELKQYYLYSLIRHFSESKKLEGVIIDGDLRIDLKKLGIALNSRMPSISLVPEADGRYPLVNQADEIAHAIYSIYSGNESSKGIDLESHFISPDFIEVMDTLEIRIKASSRPQCNRSHPLLRQQHLSTTSF